MQINRKRERHLFSGLESALPSTSRYFQNHLKLHIRKHQKALHNSNLQKFTGSQHTQIHSTESACRCSPSPREQWTCRLRGRPQRRARDSTSAQAGAQVAGADTSATALLETNGVLAEKHVRSTKLEVLSVKYYLRSILEIVYYCTIVINYSRSILEVLLISIYYILLLC